MLKWPDVLNLAKNGNPAPDRRVEKTDAEWRKQLSPDEYHVTRKAGTERPFSSQMCSLFEPGIYSCLCCGTVLIDASEKFESGTGWPSFMRPVKANVIAYRFDGPSFLKRKGVWRCAFTDSEGISHAVEVQAVALAVVESGATKRRWLSPAGITKHQRVRELLGQETRSA